MAAQGNALGTLPIFAWSPVRAAVDPRFQMHPYTALRRFRNSGAITDPAEFPLKISFQKTIQDSPHPDDQFDDTQSLRSISRLASLPSVESHQKASTFGTSLNNMKSNYKTWNHYWRHLAALVVGVSLTLSSHAADPVASSDTALTAPTVVDFGELTGDSTYVFFFNAVKAGASTAVAGNAAWGLKVDQWNEQGVFGTTEFGVADNIFEPDGTGDPASIFEEDVHVAYVNDVTNEEVRLYINGELSGFLAGNFELSGEGKVMAARIDVDTDPMGEGSTLYSWATYDSVLTDAEIAELAAAAEPTEPPPAEPTEPVNSLELVASSNYAPVTPAIVDFGDLSGDFTLAFFFNATKGGASTAIAGNDAVAIKLDQWNEQGVFGLTQFGVADNIFEPATDGSTASVFGEDVHVAIVNDAANGEVRLYVDGVYAGVLVGNFDLAGEGKVMAARIEQDTDPMGEGSILYSWKTYNGALPGDMIAELAASAVPFDPSGPFTEPTVVDFGPVEGAASYEFFFNAFKGGASTAIAGNAAWGLKLDQWNEQGVFGLTEFGVIDHVFELEGDGNDASVFEEDVHVVFVNDVDNGEVRLYVNGEYVGFILTNFELSGPTKLLAARIDVNTDPMGEGSVFYSWAVHPSVLTEEEIATLAANAEPREPAEPTDPEPTEPTDPEVAEGVLTEPTVVDFGDLPGDATYEFFFNAVKAGASTAVAGNDSWGLKLDQWNEQGVFGITEFGVIDSIFEPVSEGSTASVFDSDVHVVFVNDISAGETRLYINGQYAGFLETNFELSGEGKVMAARIEQNTDPMGEGSLLYSWAAYPSVLSEDEIADLAVAAVTPEPTDPGEPTLPEPPINVPDDALTGPTLVDFGEITGDATYEFSFNAIKAGASTAIAGNDAWGLKLDQWNEQGVFGLTQFGVVDSIFTEEGPGSTASVFDQDVHVVFVNDVSGGQVRLYVDGLYAGFIETNFELSGQGKVMAARIEQDTDPMGEGSVMYAWNVYEGILSDEGIAALAAGLGEPNLPPVPGGGEPGAIGGISRAEDGTITIEYTGTLEAATTLGGSFEPVAGATSPYTVDPSSGDAMFFIAR